LNFYRRVYRGIASATFRVLAKGDLDADAALAFAVGSPAAAEVADAAPATGIRAEGPCCGRVRRCRDCPREAAAPSATVAGVEAAGSG
jgi:hypothetical protein